MTLKLLGSTMVVVFAALLLASAAAPAAVSKQSMLESIGRSVLAPGYAQLAARAADLSIAANTLVSNPTPRSLARAQDAWRQALLAWRRTQAYAHGPAEDLGIYPRIQFWPPRRPSIERVLRADRPIDAAYVQELGANSVGLSTLELMLFDPGRDAAGRIAAFSGPSSGRQRQYLQGLVQDLVNQTRALADAWQGPSGYAAAFGAGGQPQVNLLLNDMLEAIETGAENRLRIVIERHAEPKFRSELLEGGPSGTSQEGLLALLTGARAVFQGGAGVGVDDYLRMLKSPAAGRAETQFQNAIDAVRLLDGPLEDAIVAREDAVKRAHEECRLLEIMLKTEIASSLGVTLTFKARDGD
jgi:predicted lipoprotein